MNAAQQPVSYDVIQKIVLLPVQIIEWLTKSRRLHHKSTKELADPHSSELLFLQRTGRRALPFELPTHF